MTIRTIAILGAGNGGCAAAADLGARGYEVRLYSRSAERVAPLRERGGIDYEGSLGDGFAPISVITSNAGKAISGADLVVMMVPTHAHESMIEIAAPHLDPGQILMAAPGHTVLLIPSLLRRHGIAQPIVCETGSLPYICRMTGPHGIGISKRSDYQAFAAFPARETERLAEIIKPVFPMIVPVANVLETVFPYTNAVHHPPAILMNAGRVEATDGDYYHYYDGISPSVGRVIDALDAERLAIAEALGARATPLPQHFFRMGYTTEAARDSGLAYEVFHQSEPDRWIRAPKTLAHRFLDEDVPYGLVPLAELGRLAGVPTPQMDVVIHLASVVRERDFRNDGLTLERMGLANTPPDAVQSLLDDGYPP
jgi:opine dehydrogenase